LYGIFLEISSENGPTGFFMERAPVPVPKTRRPRRDHFTVAAGEAIVLQTPARFSEEHFRLSGRAISAEANDDIPVMPQVSLFDSDIT
jgi:hypothetical protein